MASWGFLLIPLAVCVGSHCLFRNLVHSIAAGTAICCAAAVAVMLLTPEGIMWWVVFIQPSNMFIRVLLPSLALSVLTAIPFFVWRRMGGRGGAE